MNTLNTLNTLSTLIGIECFYLNVLVKQLLAIVKESQIFFAIAYMTEHFLEVI